MTDEKRQELEVKKEKIENILQSGITSGSVDGQSVTYDHNSLRLELKRIQRLLSNSSFYKNIILDR